MKVLKFPKCVFCYSFLKLKGLNRISYSTYECSSCQPTLKYTIKNSISGPVYFSYLFDIGYNNNNNVYHIVFGICNGYQSYCISVSKVTGYISKNIILPSIYPIKKSPINGQIILPNPIAIWNKVEKLLPFI